MGDTESVDLGHSGLLNADTIPNANQSMNCFSCGECMNGVFCYACGNKNDNYRRSIWSLGVELFSSLTAFEGRIWRSLRSLILKPGQMAREFSDGARQKWTSPIRLYLALFGYVALSSTQLVAFGTKMDASSVIQTDSVDKDFSPQIFFLERRSTIRKTVSDDAVSAFEEDMADIITSANEPEESDEQLEASLATMRESLIRIDNQLAELSSDKDDKLHKNRETLQKRINKWEEEQKNRANRSTLDPNEDTSVDKDKDYETQTKLNAPPTETEENIIDLSIFGENFTLDSAGIGKAVAIGLRQPERINAPISKYLPRIMFVMMPFSMLIGAIFIRGREKAMLFDHLVHAAYIHAFSFLLLFVFILLVQFTPIPGLLAIYTLILLIYLPLSAKRMFGRGWFKTFLTSYGVGLIYTFNMMVILIILISLGLSDIIKDVATPVPA